MMSVIVYTTKVSQHQLVYVNDDTIIAWSLMTGRWPLERGKSRKVKQFHRHPAARDILQMIHTQEAMVGGNNS